MLKAISVFMKLVQLITAVWSLLPRYVLHTLLRHVTLRLCIISNSLISWILLNFSGNCY